MRFFKSALCLFSILWALIYPTPKVSIITSVFKGEKYISHFLEEITKQSIYQDCEHIIINANSPENEEAIILEYAKKFPNIVYLRLNKDPGLYGVWNIGLLKSTSDYIMTANVDDQLTYTAIEELFNFIEYQPDIDLVYGDLYNTNEPNQRFDQCAQKTPFYRKEFSLENLKNDCSPGPHPLWRKSMNLRYGLFDSSFKIIGDYEMWIRAALAGAKFKRYPKIISLFYNGSSTLSHNKKKDGLKRLEQKILQIKYKEFFR